MPNFTAGTSFTDGVTNDVTAAKLNALVADAVPTSSLSLNSTTGTIATFNSTTGTIANFTASTANITLGTIPTLTAGTTTGTAGVFTSGTITTGLIPTLTAGTTTGTAGVFTSGTIATLNSTTPTFLGAITASTNTINVGSGQIYKDATGNVGIGITDPSNYNANGNNLVVGDTTGANGITITSGTASSGGLFFADEKVTGFSGYLQYDHSSDYIRIATNSTERLRIDSSGNVGIGTTIPVSKLNVYDASGSTFTIQGDLVTSTLMHRASADTTSPQIDFRKSRGSIASPATVNTGDFLGFINFQAFGGTNNRILSRIYGQAEAYVSDTNISSNLVFQTSNVGAATPTEKMRITSAGNVGIGTTSPSAQLELSTDSAKKPSTNTWTIASDQRLKTNITNADNDRCYEIVKQVPLKRYTWRSEVYSEGQVKDRSKLGWIAQDVEAVFPKAVGTNRFAYNQVFEDVVTPELDSDGNAVLDENGVAKTKTEKRLVSEEVIEDCKDLNSDQIYAAMYGTIQKLIEKVEFLESKVTALEAL